MIIEHIVTDPDTLSRTVWRFYAIAEHNDCLSLICDEYREETRPARWRGWFPLRAWKRSHRRRDYELLRRDDGGPVIVIEERDIPKLDHATLTTVLLAQAWVRYPMTSPVRLGAV